MTSIRVRKVESAMSGSDDGESDSQEIPAFDPSHMTFVDNRCTCCPYGYHVDLDFLHCLDERQKAGYVLGNLRRAFNNKRQLRRSMEVFMHQQQQQQHVTMQQRVQAPDVTLHGGVTGGVTSGVTSSVTSLHGGADSFLSSVNQKSEATDRKLAELDERLSRQLAGNDTDGEGGDRYLEEEDTRYRTELAMRLHEERVGKLAPQQSAQHAAQVDGPATQLQDTAIVNGAPHAEVLNAVINADTSVLMGRLRDLERQVKAIPLLQVRIAVLKEEKRLLGVQLQQARTSLADKERESVREKEFHTMQDTHVLEKEVKTVFLSPSLSAGNSAPLQTVPTLPRVPTRSIGVGDSDVYDPAFNVHVHEKEMRTVFVGGGGGPRPAQRNVAILCKAAMRDVGVVYRWEEEKPLVHHVAVGVNEIGFDLTDPANPTQTSVHNVHSLISQLNMASFQTQHIHIEKDLLRQVIEERISKKVASVGIMCKFATETKHTQCDGKMAAAGSGSSSVGKSSRDMGCGDDTVDMTMGNGAIRTSGLKKSIGVGEKLVQINRAMVTDRVVSCDASTSASIQKVSQAHKATATVPVTMYPASTSTDIAIRHHAHTETDARMFDSPLDSVPAKAAADKVKVAAAEVKAVPKTAVSDKAVNTQAVSHLHRSVNTDRLATRNTGSNTDVTSPVHTDDEQQHADVKSTAPLTLNKPAMAAGTSGDSKSIKSIMKQPGTKKVKKELSFSDDVEESESAEPMEAGDDPEDADIFNAEDVLSDSDSEDGSFDEASYDGQLGEVTYKGKVDEEDAGSTGMGSDQNIRDTYELSKDLQAACDTYGQWLEDSTGVSKHQLTKCKELIQLEWFRSAGHKLSNASLVEDYLSAFNEISHALLSNIVNMLDSNGNTVLHYSVSNGNMEIVNLLLDCGVCDVNKPNKAGYSAIQLAALTSVTTDRARDILRRLFLTGDINGKASQAGQTALMLAASHGRADMVSLLVDCGADVNVQDLDGSTALMCASEHGHADIVKLLLNQPTCDPNLADVDGSTALKIAREAGHKDIAILLYAYSNFKQNPHKKIQKRFSNPTLSSDSWS